MRDAHAFEVEDFVDGETGAEIRLEERAVLFAQPLDGERFASLGDFVGHFFELGEHGLADDGAADFVDFAADELRSDLLVLRALEHVLGEHLFVEG